MHFFLSSFIDLAIFCLFLFSVKIKIFEAIWVWTRILIYFNLLRISISVHIILLEYSNQTNKMLCHPNA